MADPKKPSDWTRDHKLATASLTVAVITIFCGIFQADIHDAIFGKSPSIVRPPVPQPNAVSPPAQPANQPPTTRINPVDGSDEIYISSGNFTMGSDNASDHNPKHTVYLPGYYISKNLVTVAQYKMFCAANPGHTMPKPPIWGWDKENYPMVDISWDDATAYCIWAGMSLPTEAEWEKAARGTDGRTYPWGNAWDPAKCQCSHKTFGDALSPSPVGSYPDGASPYGVLDMAGNVWEWCNDLDPPTGERVIRGGVWLLTYEGIFRSASRYTYHPDNWSYNTGFRCVFRPAS